jgi:phosphoglycerate dehydrogenase-like enzyme
MPEPRLSVSVPDDRWLQLWPGGHDPLDVAIWDLTGPPPATPSGPHLVVVPYLGGTTGLDRLAAVPGLRVVQTLTAGYENVRPFVPDGVILCTAAGVHDASTAELAVGLAIAALRGLGEFARAAHTGAWLFSHRRSLADRTVLLVGAGGVGGAIARRLAGFEVDVTRVGSRARDDAAGHVHGVDELAALLPSHDVVFLAVPLTAATRGLVDKEFLAAMPDGALVVNVARGPVVVTGDLLAEVSTGRLNAALDVTDPEPLPAQHPLWQLPNVLISPHVGGNTSAFVPRARALLRDQLTRFAQGSPLRNQVAGPA